jgi:hypothetical protein
MAERNLPNRLRLVDGAKMKVELPEIGERETERGALAQKDRVAVTPASE